MLRIAILFLVLANAGYYAWSHGMLRELGMGPTVQEEPHRTQQQIAPDKMQVTPLSAQATSAAAPASSHAASAPASAPVSAAAPASNAAEKASDAASAPAVTSPASAPASATLTPVVATATPTTRGVCLQAAGSMDEREAQAWRTAAHSALPANSWTLDPGSISGRWMVYIGKLPDDEAVARKRTELRGMQIDYDRPGAAFEPGLSLGRFSSEEAAQRALTQLTAKGVRTARVVVERKEATVYTLRLPHVDDAMRTQLAGMKNAMGGRSLNKCN